MNYNGVVGITPELGKILQGKEDAKTTPFGDSCTSLLLFYVRFVIGSVGLG